MGLCGDQNMGMLNCHIPQLQVHNYPIWTYLVSLYTLVCLIHSVPQSLSHT